MKDIRIKNRTQTAPNLRERQSTEGGRKLRENEKGRMMIITEAVEVSIPFAKGMIS